ncbi:MAG: hypothetical protein IPK67_19280 [Planctomycetes bacterium]|nr:hypothetical protein [Planctomycetota bacterium]
MISLAGIRDPLAIVVRLGEVSAPGGVGPGEALQNTLLHLLDALGPDELDDDLVGDVPAAGGGEADLGPVVREEDVQRCPLKGDERARPGDVAVVEAERGFAPRVVLRDGIAALVLLDLEQHSIAVVDATVAVPVDLPASQAELQSDAGSPRRDGEVLLHGGQLRLRICEGGREVLLVDGPGLETTNQDGAPVEVELVHRLLVSGRCR